MKTTMTVTLGILVVGLFIASSATAQKTEKQNDRQGFSNNTGERQGNEPGDGQRHRRGGKPGSGFHMDRMMRDLNLTADQRVRIDKIMAENKKTAEPIIAEEKVLRAKMRAEWQATKPNEGTILGLHRKIRDLKDKLAEQRIAARIDVIAVLTSEQRARMLERMADREQRDDRGTDNGKGKGFHTHGRGFGPGSNMDAEMSPKMEEENF